MYIQMIPFPLTVFMGLFWSVLGQTENKMRYFIPHSHDDLGWKMSMNEYYDYKVTYILRTVLTALQQSAVPTSQRTLRKFVHAEVAFMKKFINEDASSSDLKIKTIKALMNSGQFEFVNGGMAMSDEACTHYDDIIENFFHGMHYLKRKFNAKVRNAWQLDPFGHSKTFFYIARKFGLKHAMITRLDEELREKYIKAKQLEFRWQFPDNSEIIIHHPFDGYYSPSAINCEYSEFLFFVKENFITQFGLMDAAYHYNPFYLIGGDFYFNDAQRRFECLDGILRQFPDVFYATFNDYVRDFESSPKELHTIQEDLFPYANRYFMEGSGIKHKNFWTGYFTSKPRIKHRIRRLGKLIRSVRTLILSRFFKNVFSDEVRKLAVEKLISIGEDFGTFMHHDVITGTSTNYVDIDYYYRINTLENELEKLVSKISHVYFTMCDINELATENLSSCEYFKSLSKTNQTQFVIFNPHLHSILREHTIVLSNFVRESSVIIRKDGGDPIDLAMYCWIGQIYCEVTFMIEVKALSVEIFDLTISNKQNESYNPPSQRRMLFEIIKHSSESDKWPEPPNYFRVVESNRTDSQSSEPIATDGKDISTFIDLNESYVIRNHKLVPANDNSVDEPPIIFLQPYQKFVPDDSPASKATEDNNQAFSVNEETISEHNPAQETKSSNVNVDSKPNSEDTNSNSPSNANGNESSSTNTATLNNSQNSTDNQTYPKNTQGPASSPDLIATTQTSQAPVLQPDHQDHQSQNPQPVPQTKAELPINETDYFAEFVLKMPSSLISSCNSDLVDKQVFSVPRKQQVVICMQDYVFVISEWSVTYFPKRNPCLTNIIYYTKIDSSKSGHYIIKWLEHPIFYMFNRVQSATTMVNKLFTGIRIQGEKFNYLITRYHSESFYRIESEVYNIADFTEGIGLFLNIKNPHMITDDVFYTDSNGFFEMTRKKQEPLEATIAPVVSYIYLNSPSNNIAMYAFNDRSQGGLGIDSTARFNIQHSAKTDDGNGVGQILQVKERVRLTHLVYNCQLESTSERERVLKGIRNRLELESLLLFTDKYQNSDFLASDKFETLSVSKGLRMTSQVLDIDRILIRFQNIKRSSSINVSIKDVILATFGDVNISAVDFEYPFHEESTESQDTLKPVSDIYQIKPLEFYSFVVERK